MAFKIAVLERIFPIIAFKFSLRKRICACEYMNILTVRFHFGSLKMNLV
jgi:hypothetical protein